jgi:3-oxoacyl-[acyl-carrier-protein] synthase-3
MSFSRLHGFKVAGISTCVPPHRVDNLEVGKAFGTVEVRKVVSMAGVRHRHVVDANVTAVDLCTDAARRLLDQLSWAPDTVTGLIMVTQSPDHFLPSSSCIVHARLGLSDHCAAFDVGLGCSGYPYGLYLAATMLRGGGHQRILVLHGETPSLFIDPQDQATSLLFGDAGSATALEHTGRDEDDACFGLFTDGSGADSLIIKGGGFRDPRPADPRDLRLRMDGASVFNFTIKRVPALIKDTLAYAGLQVADIDSYIFHQSNRFIMKHLVKKCELPEDRVPFILENMGNCGGPSVPLTMTLSQEQLHSERPLRLMLLGYGVGLSWGSTVMSLHPGTPLLHHTYQAPDAPSPRSPS